MSKFAMAHAMKKRMAKGGEVSHEKGINRPMANPRSKEDLGISEAGHLHDHFMNGAEKAKKYHEHVVLPEMKRMPKPNLKGLAEGGMVEGNYQSECDEHCESPCSIHPEASGYEHMPEEHEKHNEMAMGEDDMIGRIMKSHHNMYSKGGMVANDTPDEADFDENQFDDLVKDDHLEEHYTGANSGDEDGDEYDADHSDPVAKVMMKRRKQKNPHPA